MLKTFFESAYNYFLEEGMTELEERRQGSVGVWIKKTCWEEERKREKVGTSADANKWVGGEQRRSAKFERLHNYHH